jgi:membrane associated rhomboid family serine protease
MGIYDRDYYRNENPGVLDWLLPQGSATKGLFVLYIAVLVIQLLTRPEGAVEEGSTGFGWFTDLFSLNVLQILHGQIWRLFTYGFLHWPGDFLTFVFGMWFLWMFGTDLEQLYNRRNFLVFYLGAILIGGVTYTLWNLGRPTGMPYMWSAGALTALLTLCAIHFPSRTILIMFVLPVPIWILAVFNILFNLYMALYSGFRAEAPVLVHLASAAWAAGYYKYKRDYGSPIADFFSGLLRWRTRRRSSQLKLYRPETEPPREPVSVAAPPAGHGMDEHFEAKLDAVLEKIARAGKESLTADEQQILIQASELYKKKRT